MQRSIEASAAIEEKKRQLETKLHKEKLDFELQFKVTEKFINETSNFLNHIAEFNDKCDAMISAVTHGTCGAKFEQVTDAYNKSTSSMLQLHASAPIDVILLAHESDSIARKAYKIFYNIHVLVNSLGKEIVQWSPDHKNLLNDLLNDFKEVNRSRTDNTTHLICLFHEKFRQYHLLKEDRDKLVEHLKKRPFEEESEEKKLDPRVQEILLKKIGFGTAFPPPIQG